MSTIFLALRKCVSDKSLSMWAKSTAVRSRAGGIYSKGWNTDHGNRPTKAERARCSNRHPRRHTPRTWGKSCKQHGPGGRQRVTEAKESRGGGGGTTTAGKGPERAQPKPASRRSAGATRDRAPSAAARTAKSRPQPGGRGRGHHARRPTRTPEQAGGQRRTKTGPTRRHPAATAPGTTPTARAREGRGGGRGRATRSRRATASENERHGRQASAGTARGEHRRNDDGGRREGRAEARADGGRRPRGRQTRASGSAQRHAGRHGEAPAWAPGGGTRVAAVLDVLPGQ